jgi:hypothetical protein
MTANIALPKGIFAKYGHKTEKLTLIFWHFNKNNVVEMYSQRHNKCNYYSEFKIKTLE